MSVLETPRIYFKGEVAWDPIVSNNFDTNYDEDAGETIFPAAADKVKAFRAQAISQVAGGNWNPHGTHRAVFYDSAVSAVDVGAGAATNDPFVAASVQFTGMLVDLEPFGAMSSQLYFDSMHFGIDGGYRILAPRSSRVTARYINFARNSANTMIAGVASAVWQASFAKSDGLRVDAFDSKALQISPTRSPPTMCSASRCASTCTAPSISIIRRCATARPRRGRRRSSSPPSCRAAASSPIRRAA